MSEILASAAETAAVSVPVRLPASSLWCGPIGTATSVVR